MENPYDIPFQLLNCSTVGESSADEFSKLRACWREVYQQNQPIVQAFSSANACENKSPRKRTLSEEQRIKNNLRRRTSAISEEARLKRNARRRVGAISEEMRLKQNARRKIGVISEEKRIWQNARRRIGVITEDQRMKQNLRRRVGVISEEQRLKQNLRRRIGVISEEQRFRQNYKRRKTVRQNEQCAIESQKDIISEPCEEQSVKIKSICTFVPHHFPVDDDLTKKQTYLREYYRNRALSEEYRLLKNLKQKKNHTSKINNSHLTEDVCVDEKYSKMQSKNKTAVPSSSVERNHHFSSNSVFQSVNTENSNQFLATSPNIIPKEFYFVDSSVNMKNLAHNQTEKRHAFLKGSNEYKKAREPSQEKSQNNGNIVVKAEDFENYEKFMHWMENE